MESDIKIGDTVKLIGVPDWLVHDLPSDEQAEIVACVGKTAIVTDIDNHDLYWIGFGSTVEENNDARYSGHSFGVSIEYLQKIE